MIVYRCTIHPKKKQTKQNNHKFTQFIPQTNDLYEKKTKTNKL